MDNRKILQISIDYIEQNLKTEITAKELADMAGFSVFHYYRLFQSAIGMPVMQYILRRRILNALYDISRGGNITDVALVYGFDTFAGFYKACRREIGYTPSDFLKKYKAKRPYKINLFKEEYIMVAHKKISEILGYWGLQSENIRDIYYEGTGNHNDNAYYVGEQYVIKFTANLGKLKKHMELSKALDAAGLFAATTVKTDDGREFVESEGLYYYLTKRLDGEQIKSGDILEGDYTSKARFLGEMIGQLHEALKSLDVVVDDASLYESVVNWAMPKAKEAMGLPEEICEEYSKCFGENHEKLPRQIIHRDPNPGNIIMNGGKWGFIDFELSERNIRIYDPCYAATAILSECFTKEDDDKLEKWIAIYKNIIYGYDSVAKLTEDERKAIPYVILSNQFVCIAYFSEREKFEDIYKVNVKMTEWIVENVNKLQI